MIVSTNLTFKYNLQTQFQFPDITCQAGESLLVTGVSGKGKTTLLHLLAGLLKPDTGNIRIDNQDFTAMSEKETDRFRGKNMGLVLQQNHFIASISVLENIMLASWLTSRDKKKQQALDLLEQLNLKEQANKLPSQLSVGQQQRVSIARALINKPKVLLADEPTSSLDDENAQIVANLLSEVAKKHGASLIIVTHDQRLKDIYKNSITL